MRAHQAHVLVSRVVGRLRARDGLRAKGDQRQQQERERHRQLQQRRRPVRLQA